MRRTVELTESEEKELMELCEQEREAYLEHQAMRTREELEKVEYEREANKVHKAHLIEQILKHRPGVWTREELTGKSLSYIERIA